MGVDELGRRCLMIKSTARTLKRTVCVCAYSFFLSCVSQLAVQGFYASLEWDIKQCYHLGEP